MTIRRILFFFGVMTILCSSELRAATLNCNGSQSDCQSKVNSAVDGDIVAIPAGTFSWGGGVSWTNKNITVQGAGIGKTILNLSGGNAFKVLDALKASFRITGMTINGGDGSTGAININSGFNYPGGGTNGSVYGWRIDHINFTPAQFGAAVYVWAINWGLVDHCTFNGDVWAVYAAGATDGEFPVSAALGEGGNSWKLPTGRGTTNAIYIEDSTYNATASNNNGMNDMTYGVRMVIRHNTINGGAYIQSHMSRGNDRGGNINLEVYNNNIVNGQGFFRTFLVYNGTGAIYNNTIQNHGADSIDVGDWRVDTDTGGVFGMCSSSNPVDGHIEANGWPCMDQLGRGVGAYGSQPSVPLMAWHNGTSNACNPDNNVGGSCDNTVDFGLNVHGTQPNLAKYIKGTAHSNGNVDFCGGAGQDTMPATCGNITNTYRPLTYPHPLASGSGGGGGTPPNPPAGLGASVQ
jgi:hypothetical protein